MRRINPDKALALPPVQYQIANVDQPLPDNWLHLSGEELIKQWLGGSGTVVSM